jgi:hypothetical protein
MKRSSVARAAVAAAACALLAQGVAFGAEEPIGLTAPVHASAASVDPGRLLSSPALAVDPKNPMRVVAGYADLRTRRCGLMRSLDGGGSWTMLDSSPALASYPFCAQGQGGVIQAPVHFGRNGTLYMALGGWDDQDGTRNAGAILVARSNNLGDSWETTMVHNARGKTDNAAENPRPVHSFAVDRFSGSDDTLYVTFNIARPNPSAPNANPPMPVVSVSNDGGRTFGAPVNLADKQFDDPAIRRQAFAAVTTTVPAPNATTTTVTTPPANSKAAQPDQSANFGGSGARASVQTGVDGKGTAYVLWMSGTANVTPSPPSARYLSTSTDGGKNWTTTQVMPFDYENASPRMAVSKDGVIHIVYGRNPTPEINGYGEIYHQASTDGGKTWTDAKAITDDDPKALLGQYFPNVSVAPNGRVDAVWWDVRDDPGIRSNDVYYAYSNDNGKTWSKNQRITDRSVDRRLGVWGANYDINSPPAVTSTDAYALFGWDDTRNTTEFFGPNATSSFGDGLQDIYTAAVQFKVVGGGTSNAAKVALATVGGLILVGLILLAVAVSSKRRTPSAPRTTVGDRADAAVH